MFLNYLGIRSAQEVILSTEYYSEVPGSSLPTDSTMCKKAHSESEIHFKCNWQNV